MLNGPRVSRLCLPRVRLRVQNLPGDASAHTIRDMDPRDITQQFNHAITNRDPDALASLMTDDHQFVDTRAKMVSGKEACLQAWRGFFEQFGDYRNVFTRLEQRGDIVIVVGYSECATRALGGPALWTSTVRDNKVAEWRVYEDTPATRASLGLA
jgi:ketosteroid isomerase-like protein